MSKIAAPALQIPTRPTTAHAAAPAAPKAAAGKPAEDKPVSAPAPAPEAAAPKAPAPAPAAPALSQGVLGVLIDVQAKAADHPGQAGEALQRVVDRLSDHGHEAPQGDHGDHGKPPVQPPPPVVQPPVTPPPVTPPPVTQPPTPAPQPVVFDLAAPARAMAAASQVLADEQVSAQARSTFVAASAERQAYAAVTENQTASAVLAATLASLAKWQSDWAAPRSSLLDAWA